MLQHDEGRAEVPRFPDLLVAAADVATGITASHCKVGVGSAGVGRELPALARFGELVADEGAGDRSLRGFAVRVMNADGDEKECEGQHRRYACRRPAPWPPRDHVQA